MKYIKSDVKKAIKKAKCIQLYRKDGTMNVLWPKKGEDFAEYVKKGLEKEYSKLVMIHEKGNTTEIEVVNRNAKV